MESFYVFYITCCLFYANTWQYSCDDVFGVRFSFIYGISHIYKSFVFLNAAHDI